MDDEARELVTAVVGSTIAGLVIWAIHSRFEYAYFPYEQLIDIEAAAPIAEQLPKAEDDFILSAWEAVADPQALPYEHIGSDITFVDNTVRCRRCFLPTATLKRGRGNCFAKAALLVSVLRNRLPASRVYMALGRLNTDGYGGHVWAEVKRADRWYLVESTMMPGDKPWYTVNELDELYYTEALVNDRGRVCYDKDLCVVVEGKKPQLDIAVGKRLSWNGGR